MLLTNLIISSILSLNSITLFSNNNYEIKNPVNTNTSYNFLKDENNFFKISSKALLVNSVSLIYTDIFVCTKPNYIRTNININISSEIKFDMFNNRYVTNNNFETNLNIAYYEENPVAHLFFKNSLWELGFLAANSFNILAISYLNQIDASGILGYTYILTLSILETAAIMSWKKETFIPKDLRVDFPIITFIF